MSSNVVRQIQSTCEDFADFVKLVPFLVRFYSQDRYTCLCLTFHV